MNGHLFTHLPIHSHNNTPYCTLIFKHLSYILHLLFTLFLPSPSNFSFDCFTPSQFYELFLWLSDMNTHTHVCINTTFWVHLRLLICTYALGWWLRVGKPMRGSSMEKTDSLSSCCLVALYQGMELCEVYPIHIGNINDVIVWVFRQPRYWDFMGTAFLSSLEETYIRHPGPLPLSIC